MNEFKNVLVIDITGIYAQGLLFQVSSGLKLLAKKRVLKSLSSKDLIEVMKLSFKGQFDDVVVVQDSDECFQNAIKNISPWGVTLGVMIGEKSTVIEYAKYGREINSRPLKLGLGSDIEKTLVSGGMDYLQDWLNVVLSENDRNKAINFIGNMSLFPTMERQGIASEAALIGLVRFLLTQVGLVESFYVLKSSMYEREDRSTVINRVVISGRIFEQVSDFAALLLTLIDGLKLEGVWEILIDDQVILPSIGALGLSQEMDLDSLQLIKLGSVLSISHEYGVGDLLGSVKFDFGFDEPQTLDLKSGEIIKIALDKGMNGDLELNLKQDVEVKGYSDATRLSGGTIGLVVDVRSRPLSIVNDADYFKLNYPHWHHALQ